MLRRYSRRVEPRPLLRSEWRSVRPSVRLNSAKSMTTSRVAASHAMVSKMAAMGAVMRAGRPFRKTHVIKIAAITITVTKTAVVRTIAAKTTGAKKQTGSKKA